MMCYYWKLLEKFTNFFALLCISCVVSYLFFFFSEFWFVFCCFRKKQTKYEKTCLTRAIRMLVDENNPKREEKLHRHRQEPNQMKKKFKSCHISSLFLCWQGGKTVKKMLAKKIKRDAVRTRQSSDDC